MAPVLLTKFNQSNLDVYNLDAIQSNPNRTRRIWTSNYSNAELIVVKPG